MNSKSAWIINCSPFQYVCDDALCTVHEWWCAHCKNNIKCKKKYEKSDESCIIHLTRRCLNNDNEGYVGYCSLLMTLT